jgi:hypothetical protein
MEAMLAQNPEVTKAADDAVGKWVRYIIFWSGIFILCLV